MKKVSIVTILCGFIYMFTLSVPPVTPIVSISPVISETRQVSININVNINVS